MLYSLWTTKSRSRDRAGNEFLPPKGVVGKLGELEPEKLVFTEQFLYRITPSVVSRKFVVLIRERRRVECEAPRRGDAGTSSRSGNEAGGLPPPHSNGTNFRLTTLARGIPHATELGRGNRWWSTTS